MMPCTKWEEQHFWQKFGHTESHEELRAAFDAAFSILQTGTPVKARGKRFRFSDEGHH
jgi:hypothetical protein